MRPTDFRPAAVAAAAMLLVLACATHAAADPVKCKRAIAKEFGKYVAATSKLLDKCKNAAIAKGTGTVAGCKTDPAVAQKIADAAQKMRDKIAGACGGADKTCGTAGDDSLASINWNVPQCMGLEGGIPPPACDNAIADCDDVATCLLCIGDKAVEQSVDTLLYDRFFPGPFATKNAENKCQIAIAKSAVKFLQAKSKTLNKCVDAKLKGKTGFTAGVACPAADSSGKTAAAIAKAEQKKVAAICKACGAGGDADKNSQCDSPGTAFGLATIVNTPYSCLDVTVPGGEDCGAIAVSDLASYVHCIDCVLEYKADCTSAAGSGDTAPVNDFAYPTECNPPTPTPTATPTPTQTGPTATPTGSTPQPTCTPNPNCGNGVVDAGEECDPAVFNSCPGNALCAPADLCADACTCPTGSFRLDATAGADLDTGWTGIAHDQAALVGHLFDASTYGCSSGGPDQQCSYVAQYSVPFFGPPLPLSSGGVPVCVVNELVGTADGTLDLGTGEFHYDYDLISRVHTGLTVDHPCPTCDGDPGFDDDVLGGTCNGGPSNGAACDADGMSSVFGDTSFNCFPDAAANIGNLPISFKDANTGTKTAAITAASPSCTAFGFTGFQCFCDTCDTAAAEPCTSNADCPAGHTCGGLRCLVDAPTPGAQCSSEGTGSDPACCDEPTCTTGTIGTCGHPGEPTKPNACSNGNCVVSGLEGPDDARCQVAPTDNLCSVESFRGCTSNSDCRPPAEGGTCGSCAPGMQTCTTKRRECFQSTVTKHGTPGIPNGAYVGNFCIAPTGSAGVNSTAGLPGLGTLRLPYALTINVP